jgi:uncharacterized protein (DUF2384 family)
MTESSGSSDGNSDPQDIVRPGGDAHDLSYQGDRGLDVFVRDVASASPLAVMELERHGVPAKIMGDLARRMELPVARLFEIVKIPRSTALRKVAASTCIDGSAGLTIIGIIRLLGIARRIVDESAPESERDFDTIKWFAQWIEQPQPALGGSSPAEFLDTPTGISMIAQMLGAMQSGAYV